MPLIPTARLTDWTPGTRTGVKDGIPIRTTLVDVTQPPYYAAGNVTETTGSITEGTNTLTVASAADFAVEHYITVGLPSITQVVIDTGASSTGTMSVAVGNSTNTAEGLSIISVPVVSGDSAEVVAGKIRAATYPASIEPSGSGATVVFTNKTAGPRQTGSIPNGGIYNNQGVTGTWSNLQTGVVAISDKITAIDGNELTMYSNATATVTGAIVAHNDGPWIQYAITQLAADEVLYLPSGTYRLEQTLSVAGDNITIRGDGESTVLRSYAGTGISVGNGNGWTFPSGDVTTAYITAGNTKDSTSITVVDASGYTVGSLVMVSMANDYTLPVFGVTGFDAVFGQPLRRQITKIMNKVGNVLTIHPPIYGDYYTPDAYLAYFAAQSDRVGIEDLYLDFSYFTEGLFGISFGQTNECWIKGVHIKNHKNYGISVDSSLNVEIRNCFVDQGKLGGSNGAGILVNTVAGGLFEDNIVYLNFPHIEVNYGSCGNVFGYNFLENSDMALLVNHGPHNSFNLYEGNIGPSLLSDGYFGSESELTVFRNWIYTLSRVNRFSRNPSFVSNVLGVQLRAGDPNIGNPFNNGNTASLIDDDPWPDWLAEGELTTRTSATAGVVTFPPGTLVEPASDGTAYFRWAVPNGSYFQIGATSTASNVLTIISGTGTLPDLGTMMTFFGGVSDYQELDLDVAATLIKKGNYYVDSETTDSLDGDTPPTSLYRSSKPSFLTASYPWPVIDPEFPPTYGQEAFEALLPAAYRYYNGEDPPGPGTGTLTCETINVTTFTLG